MNINVQGLKLFNNFSSKAEQNRMERQQKRDNQIAFIENQKHNLKNIQSESIEDIKKKLQMIEDYDNQIAAVKAEYNHEQVFHMLDEAWETGEKIAEAAEKAAPKTPEERKEELIEEATGVEKSDGLLADVMDDPTDIADEMEEMEGVTISEADLICDDRMAAEQSEGAVQGKESIEEIEENLEEMDENMESVESVEDIPEEDKLIAEEMENDQSIDGKTLTEQQRMEELMMNRKRIDIKV